jgi:hypothetical protein
LQLHAIFEKHMPECLKLGCFVREKRVKSLKALLCKIFFYLSTQQKIAINFICSLADDLI